MRAALELIVRPFVVTNVTSPKQPAVGAGAATTQQNTTADFGSDEVTTWSGSYNQTVSFYYIKKPKEKQKDSGDPINPFAPAASLPDPLAGA
jgi:hypothetical protein